MTKEEQEVLEVFEEMQQAMIDKDVEKMTSLVSEDKVFVHMSGRTQTKEEFFQEIKDGILNYYGYTIENPRISIDGNQAVFDADVTLNAKVYGMRGSWTLQTHAIYQKIDGKWIQVNR